MKQFLSIVLLATLLAPLSLSAQAKLEDNLKSVMLLFDKTQKESEQKIQELTQTNRELTTSNVKMLNSVTALEAQLKDLQREAMIMRSKLSEVAIKEFETAALKATPAPASRASMAEPSKQSTPKKRRTQIPAVAKQENPDEEPIPDFSPNFTKNSNTPIDYSEHLSDGAVLLVNINTATERELRLIPGVGPAMAVKLMDNRPFGSIWDLMKIDGIGRERVKNIAPYITMD